MASQLAGQEIAVSVRSSHRPGRRALWLHGVRSFFGTGYFPGCGEGCACTWRSGEEGTSAGGLYLGEAGCQLYRLGSFF